MKQRLEPIAKKGFPRAEYSMGILCKEFFKEKDNAVMWYQRAFSHAQEYAARELAWSICTRDGYSNGIEVARNEKKAVEWYHKAAEQGYKHAQQKLGNCYEYGSGIEKDEKKAVEWYLRATKHTGKGDYRLCKHACYKLAGCYMNGVGVEKDMVKAREWCIKGDELESRGE